MKRTLAAVAAAAALTLTGVGAASSAHADALCVSNVRQHSRVYWTITPNGQPFEGTVVHLFQRTGTATVAWDTGQVDSGFPVDELTTCNPVL